MQGACKLKDTRARQHCPPDRTVLLPTAACTAVGGVNYLAILETAADIAKAMLHLHSLNVLHSDL